MADLTITASDVAIVRQSVTIPGIAGEAITAGESVTFNTAGKVVGATDSDAIVYIAANSAATGDGVTVCLPDCILDLGDALSGLAYTDPVYASTNAGKLADAGTMVIGRVVPIFGEWSNSTGNVAKRALRVGA